MAFYVGMFIGIALGLGLIIAFSRYENIRSKRRLNLVQNSYFLLFYHTFSFFLVLS